MKKSAPVVALITLLGTAFVAPTAAAAPPPGTHTVNIDAGQTLSEVEPLIVTELHPSAESVRVTYAGELLAPMPVVQESPGVFSATGEIDTWGLAGAAKTLTVAQCAGTDGTDCGEPVIVDTNVDNPDPTPALSRPGSEFSEDVDLTVGLAVGSGSPRLRLTTDTGAPEFVDPGDVTPVDIDALVEGPHQIAVDVCSTDQTRCVPGDPVGFEVVRSVAGSFSLSAPALSPNGDGKFDTVDFDYTQVDTWASASVEVRNAVDQAVYTSAVPLPVPPSNSGTFPYDGKDTLGAALPDGGYTATLSVTRTLDSGDTAASAYQRSFTVDTAALAPGPPIPQWSTIYPYADGYRDATRFAYADAETYSRVDLQVFTPAPDFSPVRSRRVLVPSDASWNGRDNAGARVPAGSYQVRLRVVDLLGNVGFTPLATVNVNDKKLVTVTRAVTVTPQASRIGGVTGACSTRRTPSLHGWVGSTGYLSNTKCRTTFKASTVWTHNQVKLPGAVTYRDVRLGWYGGPTRAATRDRAIATLYRKDGTAQGWFSSLDYMASQYIPWVKGWRVVDNGVVSWGFQTDRGNRYDVKSFTITYRADVLR